MRIGANSTQRLRGAAAAHVASAAPTAAVRLARCSLPCSFNLPWPYRLCSRPFFFIYLCRGLAAARCFFIV